MPIATGTKLGSYEVQEFIGQGAMGLVYRVYHAQLERFGAVKVLQGIASGPDAAARFRHEAQAIAQMRHPNIVNVYDFGEFEGTPYMIVEYVPGGSLASKMQSQEPLDQVSALGYLRGIAEGLDYAHSLGIVHRDVKPANVLLERNGSPVLADFGLVKLMQGSSLQSLTGVTTGTPAYMAPEQVMGHQVGAAADRYSLATIAYEMLTGSIPFSGEGVLELLYAHVHREPQSPSSRNAALSPAVDAVILRGLAKDPNARWASCTEFVDALAAALVGAPMPVADRTIVLPPPQTATKPLAPAKRTRRAAAAAATTVALAMPEAEAAVAAATPEQVDTAPKPPRSRRRAFEIIAAAVIVLLLLVAGGICAAADQKPNMSVSPNNVVPGQSVLVTAAHLPANQLGEIHLLTQLYTFQFQADAGGEVRTQFQVPLDIALGDHHVWLCWNSACQLVQPLRVGAPGTVPSPTPSSSPTPSPSGTPTGKATPGKSPTPRSTPGSTPTTGGSTPKASPRPSHGPSPVPSPHPSPTPSPTPNPCPTPPGAPVLKANPTTVIGGNAVSLAGTNFTPNTQVTLRYYKGNTLSKTWSVAVLCSGTFSTSVTTAGGLARTDHVTALDTAGRSATAYMTVLL